MTAIGVDIGGTKIELQVFADDWQRISQSRIETPRDYSALIEAVCQLVEKADRAAGPQPLGISVAGFVDRQTGLALTSNLPASGKRLYADLTAQIGRPVAFINDCRAMALSEAHLGFGRGSARVLGLVLGTGVGSGFIRDGLADEGASGIVAELGHVALPGRLVEAHGLPILRCGCGRDGCYETLVSGPGLGRLAQHLTGQVLSAPEVVALRGMDSSSAAVWALWCDLVAELLCTAILTLDPEVIVLGGGLSTIDGIIDDLRAALVKTHIRGMRLPRLGIAQGGDATGARGAALAAWQMHNTDRLQMPDAETN